MTDKLRMDAYYYGFDSTGVLVVDKMLSAVACAGKGFHNTEDWNDKCEWPGHTGETPVDWIQNAANEAATEIERLRAALRSIANNTGCVEACPCWAKLRRKAERAVLAKESSHD